MSLQMCIEVIMLECYFKFALAVMMIRKSGPEGRLSSLKLASCLTSQKICVCVCVGGGALLHRGSAGAYLKSSSSAVFYLPWLTKAQLPLINATTTNHQQQQQQHTKFVVWVNIYLTFILSISSNVLLFWFTWRGRFNISKMFNIIKMIFFKCFNLF